MSVWFSDVNNPDKIELGKITTQDPTYETLKDWFNATQSSGLLCGGEFTDNTDGSITVATGCGIVKTLDDIVGNTIFFDWLENVNVSLTDLLTNWIYVDYNGGSPVINSTTDFSTVDFTTQFIIGFVFRDGTALNMIQAGSRRQDFAHRVLLQDFEVNGFSRASGLNLGETGTRNISILEGVFYILTQRTEISAIDTSGSDTFTYYYSDGAGGWTEVTGQTQINNVYYDDGDGTLEELTPNQYGVHWIYQDFSGNVHVVYGLGSYKLSAANDVQPPASGSIPPFLDTFAFISGKIIIEKNASAFAELHSAFDVIFTPSVSIPHNDTTSIQGGTTDEYYHLTSEQHTLLTGNLFQSHNLLTNSGFSVNSQSTLENYGTQITLTDVTAGVCLTADTQDIAVGDLFRFDSGDHNTVVGRVADVTTDVSFTLSDTTLTDSGLPGTGYKTVPGYVAADNKAPDGWYKDTTLDIAIDNGSAILIPSAADDFLRWPKDNTDLSHLLKYQGRTVTFAIPVTTSIASHARLMLYDGTTTTYSSYHTGGGSEEFLSVTAAIGSSISEFSASITMSTASGDVTVKETMLIFGNYIDEGNYTPIPQEYVPLDASSVSVISNEAISADASYDIYLETEGKMPPSTKQIACTLVGSCATVNKGLGIGMSYDVPIRSTVTNVNDDASGKARCTTPGVLDLYRTDTFANVTIRIMGVYL